MVVLVLLLLVAVVLILLQLWALAQDVRTIKWDLSRARKSLEALPSYPNRPMFGHHVTPVLGFFVVWEWKNGRWHPKLDNLPRGVDPGTPPDFPGSMTGEHAKTWVSKEQR